MRHPRWPRCTAKFPVRSLPCILANSAMTGGAIGEPEGKIALMFRRGSFAAAGHRIRRGPDRIQRIIAAVGTGLVILLGGVALLGTYVYVGALQEVDQLERLPDLFAEADFAAPQVFDRTGQVELFSLRHPVTEDRRWLTTDPTEAGLSQQQLTALIALTDPGYWENSGYDRLQLMRVLLGTARPDAELTISERVARMGLGPQAGRGPRGALERLQLAVLSQRLNQTRTKDQILSWYINGAYFGNGAYGFDSAALLYFGRHAPELTLGELALLARVADSPDLNPYQTPHVARLRQIEAMEHLYAKGLVTRESVRSIILLPAEFRQESQAGRFPEGYAWLGSQIWEHMEALIGPPGASSGGLRILASIDADMQAQAACGLQAHIVRLNNSIAVEAEAPGPPERCAAGENLAPLRPGEIGVDHQIGSGAAVWMDPRTGEVLALYSTGWDPSVSDQVEAGQAIYPFIYLAAFAEGSAPGTMVLDVPRARQPDPGLGPVRMRVALANGLSYAALNTLDLAGLETVQRIRVQMGLDSLEWIESPRRGEALETRLSLLNLAEAYAILANEGRRVAVELDSGRLEPIFIRSIVNASGDTVYEHDRQFRAVVSRELAFMINDVLRDRGALDPELGDYGRLLVDWPSAALAAEAGGGSSTLALGYGPELLGLIWMGNADGRPSVQVDRFNGAAPVWQALMRYASLDRPASDWERPPGLEAIEVCDPSGLLPDQDCPRVVTEIFPLGAGPVVSDDLYQTLQVNSATGRLATIETPVEQIDERTYLVPPSGAEAWAEQVGLPRPPEEYDEISEDITGRGEARIEEPSLFAVVSGEVAIRGHARPQDFAFYRLQFGQGLNPDRWIQLGQETDKKVWGGILGTWNTAGLSGLYTVQLLAVDQGGTIHSAAVPVTVDNQPPEAVISHPFQTQEVSGSRLLVEVKAEDNVEVGSVLLYLDGRLIARLTEPPYLVDIHLPAVGSHLLNALVEDVAGNSTQADGVRFTVVSASSQLD